MGTVVRSVFLSGKLSTRLKECESRCPVLTVRSTRERRSRLPHPQPFVFHLLHPDRYVDGAIKWDTFSKTVELEGPQSLLSHTL